MDVHNRERQAASPDALGVRAQLLETKAATVRERAVADRLRRSVRYRLGEVLVQWAKTPLRVRSSLVQIIDLLKHARRRSAWTQFLSDIETGVVCEPLRDRIPPRLTKSMRRLYACARSSTADQRLSGEGGEAHARFHELLELPDAPLISVEPASQRSEPSEPTLLYVLNAALPMTWNGYSIRSHAVLRALADSGLKVRAISVARIDLDDDVVDYMHDGINYRVVSRSALEAGIGRNASSFARHVTDFANEIDASVIVSASNWLIGWAGLIAARQSGRCFGYEVRGFWEETRAASDPLYRGAPAYKVQRAMESRIAGSADRVFTLNVAMRDELIGRGVPAGQIDLIPNGVGRAEGIAQPPAHAAELRQRCNHVVGLIGSLTPYEGLETLFDAVVDLNNGAREVGLLIVGDGPSYDEIYRRWLAAGAPDWCVLTGRLPKPVAEACYALLDIVCCARTKTEVTRLVQPLKPLEAMSHAVAVIVSDLPALLELNEDGEHCLVCEAGSADSLRDQIRRLIEDTRLRNQVARAGQEWVLRNRSWEHCLEPLARFAGRAPQ
jgi:glycosyltransferase involved in cell wall biosynthesis